MSWPVFFYPHQVTIKPLVGAGGLGSSFGAPFTASAEVKDEKRLVRDRDGAEVVSSSTVTVPLETNCPVGSMVTVWPGTEAERTAKVLSVGHNDNADVPLDDYLVLWLT